MREILFRGKATNREEGREYRTNYKNGEWVYGLLTDTENYAGFAEMTNVDGVSSIEVDKKTVGQYTGLNDKNGTKIFEGDILEYINEDNEPHCIIVIYEDCAFLIEDNGIIDADLLTSYVCLGLKVIGNIYDNPELARGEQE